MPGVRRLEVSPTIAAHLVELRQAASYAALNYEVWWVYKSADTRPQYVDTMNRYHIFFATGIHAHFVAMIAALYRVYETRDDTHNFKTLLSAIADQASDEATRQFQQRFETLRPIWIKVSRLRNEAFGHRSASASIKDIFAAVQVTADEFKQLIVGTQELLNSISVVYDKSVHAFNTGAREDTLRLLEDLKSCEGRG